MAGRSGEIREEYPTWRPRSKLTSEVQLHLRESYCTLDKELLASKSAKVAKLLSKNPHLDLSRALYDVPADQESLELIARFCHGFKINLSSDNVVRVACVAHYLGMTENHCPDNLINATLSFLKRQVLPSWSDSIKALKSAENVLEHATNTRVIDYCVESVIKMVVDNPRLLGEPITASSTDQDIRYWPNVRRKLFDLDWKSENLVELPLRLYAPIMRAMAKRDIPEEYIVANICQYAKKWIFSNDDSHRETVEALESLLQERTCDVPCSILTELLKSANDLGANSECQDGLETQIGKQLDHASVKDLLVIFHRKDEKYDVDCVRRILKNFYRCYVSPNPRGLNAVAELIEKFLEEIASDVGLKTNTFVAMEEMLAALATFGMSRASDGLYRAIDVYLETHKAKLTESEKEEVCRVLDCEKMTEVARQHAGRNERLPIRVVVQVLFASQLRLREAAMAVPEGVREEMGDLERECGMMNDEETSVLISSGENENKEKKKMSVWKVVKRKLGCVRMEGDEDCNCHVKKKKKKKLLHISN